MNENLYSNLLAYTNTNSRKVCAQRLGVTTASLRTKDPKLSMLKIWATNLKLGLDDLVYPDWEQLFLKASKAKHIDSDCFEMISEAPNYYMKCRIIRCDLGRFTHLLHRELPDAHYD